MLIDLDSRRLLASGLDWVLLQADETVREVLQAHDAAACVTVKAAEGGAAAASIGYLPRCPKKPCYALAALVADWAIQQTPARLNLLACFDAGRHGVLLVALLDGLPVAQFDQVGSAEAMQALAERFLTEWQNLTEVHCVGDVAWLPATPLALGELLRGLEDRETARRCQLQRPPGAWVPWAMLAMLLLGVGGYYGYQQYVQWEAAERLANSPQLSPQAVYDASLPALVKQAGWPLNAGIAIVDELLSRDTERGGWRIQAITASPEQTEIRWVRKSPQATFRSFLQGLSVEQQQAVVMGLDALTERRQRSSPQPALDTAQLPTRIGVYRGALSEFQRLTQTGSAQLQLGELRPLGTPAPGVRTIQQGSASLSGDLWLLPMLREVDRAGLAVHRIELLQLDSKPQFKLSIHYLVQP